MSQKPWSLVNPPQKPSPDWAIAGVILGVLVATGITFFILGTVTVELPSGPMVTTTFKQVLLAVYVSLALPALALLVLRHWIAALVFAWLPLILALIVLHLLSKIHRA